MVVNHNSNVVNSGMIYRCVVGDINVNIEEKKTEKSSKFLHIQLSLNINAATISLHVVSIQEFEYLL